MRTAGSIAQAPGVQDSWVPVQLRFDKQVSAWIRSINPTPSAMQGSGWDILVELYMFVSVIRCQVRARTSVSQAGEDARGGLSSAECKCAFSCGILRLCCPPHAPTHHPPTEPRVALLSPSLCLFSNRPFSIPDDITQRASYRQPIGGVLPVFIGGAIVSHTRN